MQLHFDSLKNCRYCMLSWLFKSTYKRVLRWFWEPRVIVMWGVFGLFWFGYCNYELLVSWHIYVTYLIIGSGVFILVQHRRWIFFLIFFLFLSIYWTPTGPHLYGVLGGQVFVSVWSFLQHHLGYLLTYSHYEWVILCTSVIT